MALLLVTYDITGGDSDGRRKHLHAWLTELGGRKLSESSYAVPLAINVETFMEIANGSLQSTDILTVATLARPFACHGSNELKTWLASHLPLQ